MKQMNKYEFLRKVNEKAVAVVSHKFLGEQYCLAYNTRACSIPGISKKYKWMPLCEIPAAGAKRFMQKFGYTKKVKQIVENSAVITIYSK